LRQAIPARVAAIADPGRDAYSVTATASTSNSREHALYTTLVVDDEPLVLAVVAAALADDGFDVITAGDGHEAIRVLEDRAVDLLVTDIRMPGIDGVQLGRQAKVLHPALQIIYMTGFAEDARKPQHGIVLEKPIRIAALVKAVRQHMTAG
jgi:CheY-like chemotaxis protein